MRQWESLAKQRQLWRKLRRWRRSSYKRRGRRTLRRRLGSSGSSLVMSCSGREGRRRRQPFTIRSKVLSLYVWFYRFLQVLKSKPSDIGLVAVASNNLLCLNRDQNIFDSKKRLKAATVEGLELKLTSSQRRQIARNSALLAMFTAQVRSSHPLKRCWVLVH